MLISIGNIKKTNKPLYLHYIFGATLHLLSKSQWKQKRNKTNYMRLLSLTINFLSISKVMAVALGSNSMEVQCPRCQAIVPTSVKSEPGLSAWIAGGLICFLGCFCGCCLIPCGIESMKVYTHSCPKCKSYLGKYAGTSSMGNSESVIISQAQMNRT